MAPQTTVSVCLPVYNGERYIGQAIKSVLAQTFQDLELIISDNASSDATRQVCERASAGDSRVNYFRSDVNRGLAWNFNRAFSLARGRYLVWLGHDDVMGCDYIRGSIEALERDGGAVLCFANTAYIDERGMVVRKTELSNPGRSERPSDRFQEVLYNVGCDAISGVIKRDVLKQTRLHGPYADSDRVLLVELALRGRFCLIPTFMFSKRQHALQTTARYQCRWERTLVFDPTSRGRVTYPWIREFGELARAIMGAPIHWNERRACYKRLYWWALANRRILYQDLVRGLDFNRTLLRSGRTSANLSS
jgi:glycosyltransferase involved in cell wall biosynthesis